MVALPHQSDQDFLSLDGEKPRSCLKEHRHLAAGIPAAGHLVADDQAAGAPDWGDWERPLRSPATGLPAKGVASIPMLHLEDFDGPMDLLLNLAERQRIDAGSSAASIKTAA